MICAKHKHQQLFDCTNAIINVYDCTNAIINVFVLAQKRVFSSFGDFSSFASISKEEKLQILVAVRSISSLSEIRFPTYNSRHSQTVRFGNPEKVEQTQDKKENEQILL